jgi:sugar/nucleoside kinase (ribokinase family)
VVGNLNMDMILRGVQAMPRWGQGVEATGHLLATSGQAGYLAMALAALGVPVDVIGNVGNDDFGKGIIADFVAHGVGTAGIEPSEERATGMCIAISRSDDGERAFIGDLGQLVEFGVTNVWRHWDVLLACELVCVVGIFDMPNFAAAGAAEVLARLHAAGKKTLLDMGWDGGGWLPSTLQQIHALLPLVDYLIINESEAAAISGETDPLMAARLLQQRSSHTVIVKRGKHGSYGLNEQAEINVDALSVVPADAVGAGDSYNAGFLAALLEGGTLEQCMWWGTATATLYVGRGRDRYPYRNEVVALLASVGATPIHYSVSVNEGT